MPHCEHLEACFSASFGSNCLYISLKSFKRFFEIDNPDDPKHYHIVINASDMSNQRAIDAIKFMYNQLQN